MALPHRGIDRARAAPHPESNRRQAAVILQAPAANPARNRPSRGPSRHLHAKHTGRSPASRGRRTLNIIHEDRDFIVVDKPPGILSVPFADGASPNALDMLRKMLASKKREPRIVHRIDRYTSGLLLFAFGERSRDALIQQFKDRSAERRYLAVVTRAPNPESGKLSHYLAQTAHQFRQQVVQKGARGAGLATLRYRTIERLGRGALVEVELESGFKNQIRAQFAAIGSPLVGDTVYGRADERISRQALHARELVFSHPRTGERVTFHSEVPHDLSHLIAIMKQQSR